MSKAFTKEDENELEFLEDSSEPYTAPPGGRNYLTSSGYKRLKLELDKLVLEIWPKLTADFRKSESLSPEKKSLLIQQLKDCRRRLRYLENCLEVSEVLHPSSDPATEVQFGSTVEVIESGKKLLFQIVGIEEADSSSGKISWLSPIAQALMKGKVGDIVDFETPGGDRELQIVGIENKLSVQD